MLQAGRLRYKIKSLRFSPGCVLPPEVAQAPRLQHRSVLRNASCHKNFQKIYDSRAEFLTAASSLHTRTKFCPNDRRPTPMTDAIHNRGYLPHIRPAHATFAVTFRLADSIPQEVVHRLSPADLARLLDRGLGACPLREPEVAELVERVLLGRQQVEYRLAAWSIMPNHVHAVVTPLQGHSLGQILQAWKSVTAHRINKLLRREGRLWQVESFDRVIRDESHFFRAVAYTHSNPVAAGMVTNPSEFRWSSARRWEEGSLPLV